MPQISTSFYIFKWEFVHSCILFYKNNWNAIQFNEIIGSAYIHESLIHGGRRQRERNSKKLENEGTHHVWRLQ